MSGQEFGSWTRVDVAIDIGSVATVSSAEGTATVKGVDTADVVIAIPPSGLEDDIIPKGARVSAADTVAVKVYNPTGGAIDPASATWTLLIFRGYGTSPVPLGA